MKIDYEYLKLVGGELRKLREERTNHSVNEFALLVGLDPYLYQCYEEGSVDATIMDLKHIVEYYPDYSLHKFMNGLPMD